jgi:predicted Zn-dependent protease
MLIIPHNAFSLGVDDVQVTTSWSKQQNTIKVAIINEAGLNEEKISIIKKAIESEVHYNKDGHIYFEGWAGALDTAYPTHPKKFEISESEKKITGDITIELLKNPDPNYSGFTRPNYDGNKITSASIQIFNSNNISLTQLENLVRHEFGHALGLGHASDQNSIMYEFITPDEKLITDCDMTGLKGLTEGFTFTSIDCNHV